MPTLFVFAVRRKNDLFFFLFSNCSLFVWNLSCAISLKTFVWSFVRHFCCCFQSVQTTESWTCRILFTFWVEFFSSFFFKSVCVSNQIGNSAFFTSHRCCLNRYYFVYNNVAANNAIEQKKKLKIEKSNLRKTINLNDNVVQMLWSSIRFHWTEKIVKKEKTAHTYTQTHDL